MTDARKKIRVVHSSFDWSKIEGQTIAQAGEYLLALAKTLPDDAFIADDTNSYDYTEINAVSYRDETDEEYAARKEQEAIQARLDGERRQRAAVRKAKEQEYQRLKRELGYR